MLQNIKNFDNITNITKELDQIKELLPTRIKFLVLNYIEKVQYKQVIPTKEVISTKEVTPVTQEYQKSKETYNNLIMEYIINESIDDFMNSIKHKVEGEIVISILRKYSPQTDQKLIKFIEILLQKNIITKELLNDKFIAYTDNGDIDDIADECPIILKFIDKIKSL
jgi:hypothetical protein